MNKYILFAISILFSNLILSQSITPFVVNPNPDTTYPHQETIIRYIDPITPDSYQLDKSHIVGSTSNSWATSYNGSLLYNIPIFVSPGTAGVQPNIWVEYNSQNGNGMLGLGWGIKGFSSISRIPKDFFHDNTSDNIKLDSTDKFALDGNRMIVTSGIYGTNNAQYKTERETFSTITSYGGSSNSPEWFKVWNSEGWELEYGKSDDSKVSASGSETTYMWLLNKATDPNGNYITYKYILSGGQWFPSEILYTGNSTMGIVPFNTVKFEYAVRQDIERKYISTYEITSKYLLNNIVIKNENNLVKKYKFNYSFDKYSLLSSITESAGDKTQMNPIIISWGEQNPTNKVVPVSGLNINSGQKTYSGDFNGDGLADILIIDINNVHYYLSSGNGQFQRYSLNGKYDGAYVVDLDNDGTDDVLFQFDFRDSATCPYINNNYYPMFSINSAGSFSASNLGQEPIKIGTLMLREDPPPIPNTNNRNKIFNLSSKCITGDFNGDGKNTVLFINKVCGYGVYGEIGGAISYLMYFPVHYQKEADGSIKKYEGEKRYSYDYLYEVNLSSLDFNTDRKNEIVYCGSNIAYIYSYENSEVKKIGESIQMKGTTTDYSPGIKDCAWGDINGDGKIDMLTYAHYQRKYTNPDMSIRWDNRYFWHIYYFDGEKIVGEKELPFNSPITEMKLTLIDLDGDGAMEILCQQDTVTEIYADSPNSDSLIFLASINASKIYSFADYTGDGGTDILYENYNTSNIELFSYGKGKKNSLISSITDGFGRTTFFEYKPLTDTAIYTKEETSKFPVIGAKAPMYVISSVHVPNDTNGHNLIEYSYSGGKTHLQGNGFLGFTKIEEFHHTTGKMMRDIYDYDTNYYFMFSKEKEFFDHNINSRISYSTYKNQVENFPNKRYFHYISEQTTIDEIENKKIQSAFTCDFSSGKILKETTRYYPEKENTIPEYEEIISRINYQPVFRNLILPEIIKTGFKKGNSEEIISTHYFYDNKGNTIGIVHYKDDPVMELNTLIMYTSSGLPYEKTILNKQSKQRTEYFQYDSKHRWKTKVTLPGNSINEYSYDPFYGNVLSEKGGNGLTTNYQYDSWGRLIKIIQPDGNWVKDSVSWFSSTYPFLDKVVYKNSRTSSMAKEASSYYNASGKEILSSQKGDFNTTLYQHTAYDVRGRVKIKTIPQNIIDLTNSEYNYIEYSYDPFSGKITREKDYIKKANGNTVSGKLVDVSHTYDYSTSRSTSINHITGVRTTHEYDVKGNVISTTDPTGTLRYHYSPSGKVDSIEINGGTITYTYDIAGNRKSVKDPNAGLTTYQYTGFNELILHTDAKGTYTTYRYKTNGQLTSKTITPTSGIAENYTYQYNESGAAKGLPSRITGNSCTTLFEYDEYGRKTSVKEQIDQKTFTTNYTYDQFQNLSSVTYPGFNNNRFSINYSYDENVGGLIQISDKDHATLWEKEGINGYGYTTHTSYGNGLGTYYTYDNTTRKTTRVQTRNNKIVSDWEYTYDRGLIRTREDHTSNQREIFSYNEELKLASVAHAKDGQDYLPTIYAYDENGNMTQKSDLGFFEYDSEKKPHALRKIRPNNPLLGKKTQSYKTDQCITTYTPFGKIKSIINEKGDTLEFTYGTSQQRIKTVLKKQGKAPKTTYFIGDYEYEETSSYQRQLHYIYGKQWTGVYIKDSRFNSPDKDSMYYIFTDHLGSFDRITNENGIVVESLSFDVWGNRRDPYNWQKSDTLSSRLFTRGFTGHEHLDDFELINMNGRLYDPLAAQFLSPDPLAEVNLNLSPYSYCGHDPVNYIDPSGLLYCEWEHAPPSSSTLPEMFSDLEGLMTSYINGVLRRLNPTQLMHHLFTSHVSNFIYDFSMLKYAMEGEDVAQGRGKYDGGSFKRNGTNDKGIIGDAGAIYFENNNDAYEYMWENSFENGNPIREVSAWELTNGAIIVLPHDKNTLHTSENNALPVFSSNKRNNWYVQFNNNLYEIETHIHTHPSRATHPNNPIGLSKNDLQLRNDLGRPIKIIYNESIYSVDGSYNRKKQMYNFNYKGTW